MADEKVVIFPVEATHIMMFRRSIGDYSIPDTGLEDAAAPPTFPRAVAQFDPDYFLRLKPGEPWFGSGRNPSGVDGKPGSSGGLHAEQHFEFVRPIRPGDVLRVTQKNGESWEKQSKRAGKLLFQEIIAEYRDQQGELVCTSRAVRVTTERPVDQG
ncbi:MAG: MaoC family dehydratase N-terminal domain-containing protein [Alphaproteobacteria bacterium]|nr:MaoC family dehydratase N-terminal domain-containing protein [Alphaproteobacteria bacterium]